MLGIFNQIGPAGLPLAVLALLTLVAFTKNAMALFGNSPALGADIGGIKTLGSLALAVGTFSSLLGIYQGLQIFSMLTTDQVASGLSMALPAILFGLFVFILSRILWFVLSVRLCKLNS